MSSDVAEKNEPLLRHLGALRVALIRSVIAIALTFCLTVFFAREIYHLLASPLRQVLPADSHFITLHPIEAWFTYFKTAVYASVFLSLPVIFYQVWSFISPGLHARERKTIAWCTFLSSTCFMAGGLFGYFVALPAAFRTFNAILSGSDILFLPRMEDYLGFAFQMLLAFGLVFELPLLLLLLDIAGLVNAKQMVGFRRYGIIVIFIAAAILTPPDVISQIMMAIPLLLLYEAGIGACRLYEKTGARSLTTTRNAAPVH